jgi:unsaturated chondroitin disaccharide hydrolase
VIAIDTTIDLKRLREPIDALFALSASKIRSLQKSWTPSRGAPVFTVERALHIRGWTEWTQGFLFGSALLQFDATGEKEFLRSDANGTVTVHGAPRQRHGRS